MGLLFSRPSAKTVSVWSVCTEVRNNFKPGYRIGQKITEVTHSAIALYATFLAPHFAVIWDLFLNRRMVTWNLLVFRMSGRIYENSTILSKYSRPAQIADVFSFTKVDDMKIKRNAILFLPHFFHSFYFCSFPSFFLFCMALRLPLGVVKSKCRVWFDANYWHRFHKSRHI